MTYVQYLELKKHYPEADEQFLIDLQKKQFLDSLKEKQQAEQQGQEIARAFTAAFEKELEKLFK